jgi:hypothetical protein
MAFSTYLATKILDWIAGASAVPAVPSLLALSLHNSDPGPTGTAGNVLPLITGSSTRIPILQSSLSANAAVSPVGLERVNTATITIASSSVSASPVLVSHFSLWDATSNGNLLIYDALSSSVSVLLGDAVRFDPTTLAIRAL